MGSQKGQLFLVAVVFMIGVVFAVQQSLFQYSTIEMAQAFASRHVNLYGNIVDEVNATVRNTYYCNETKDSFQQRIEKLKTSFLEEHGREYSIEIVYALNCSNWFSAPPNPSPLRITISVSGEGKDARGTFDFYHL